MKKSFALILIFCMLLALSACGGEEDSAASTAAGTTVSGSTEAATQANGSETDPTETEAAQDTGFVFVYQGVEIRLNADMAPILEQLGEPISYTEAASCAFEGLDKTYYYGSFYIDTYPDGDKDYVYDFWFSDDGVATTEGLYIGATEDLVTAAYPDAVYNGENAWTLTTEEGVLTILMADGVVTSIQYSITLS